jgi:hypothetical protein
MSTRRTVIALALAGALVLGACGGDDDDAAGDDGSEQTDGTADGSGTTAANGDAGAGTGGEVGASGDAAETAEQPPPAEGEGAGGADGAFCTSYTGALTSSSDPAAVASALRALDPPDEIAENWTQFVDGVEAGSASGEMEEDTVRVGMEVATWVASNCEPPS